MDGRLPRSLPINRRNLILSTDSYKSSHFLQYPPDTTGLFSYFESRGGQYDQLVFFGLQYILDEYLTDPVTIGDVAEAEQFFLTHGEPFNRNGWVHIVRDHGGLMPVVIKAPEEGSVIPTHMPLLTVESTCPKCAWVVNYLETILVRLWYPITVATLSWHAKKSIMEMLYKTSDAPRDEIGFKLHDFGARGVSSGESAAIGGAAHLVNFMGSDTVEGVLLANRVYNNGAMSAFSIPAAEHSTITSWGRDREKEAYENMLDQFAKPNALVAVVSDSYNLWNALDNLWGGSLKEKIQKSGATVVIRPDSGTPHEIVLACLQKLDAKFGSTQNKKGYKVLNNVRVIQGDGINPRSITEILATAARGGYSATNIAFGMGGGLLQQCNRDTLRFAFKASAVCNTANGWRSVNKDPITDPGKASKAGRQMLFIDQGKYVTGLDTDVWKDRKVEMLHEVYRDGKRFRRQELNDIRGRAASALDAEISVFWKGQ
jgi:nicotinamide phosphoribosyltransferase